MSNNALDRFGSANFADEDDIAAGGLFRETPDSLLVGFYGSRKLWHSALGGVLCCAGPRGGKFAGFAGYLSCGVGCSGQSVVWCDPKGEAASVGQGVTRARKFHIYWNPVGLHGLPQHRINPFDVLRADSPTLVADAKVFCLNMIPPSGSANSAFFERRAREFLEAIILTLVRLNGVLTPDALYAAINLIPAGGQAYLDLAFEMQESGFPISARVEEEIAAARSDPSGGYQGVLAELMAAFACLSDDTLLRAISPPYDFSFRQLCEHGQLYDVKLMPPAEYIEGWSPILKSMFVAAMLYKSRAPQAPRQSWILDEAAALAGGMSGSGGGFPLISTMFTWGAGIGIRPVCIVQSLKQLNAIIRDGETIITASAAVRIYFAIRDLGSASTVSNMLGAQSLRYDDERLQERSRYESRKALNRLIEGDDVLAAALDYSHYKREAEMPSLQHRLLRTPSEILNMPSDKAYIFADGVPHPIYGDRKAYYEQRWTRFHPNPFYPPLGRVRVKTLFGHASLDVVDEPVPPEYAHLPQHADGRWKRIANRKWWQI